MGTLSGNKAGWLSAWISPQTLTLSRQQFVMSMETSYPVSGDIRITVKVQTYRPHLSIVISPKLMRKLDIFTSF